MLSCGQWRVSHEVMRCCCCCDSRNVAEKAAHSRLHAMNQCSLSGAAGVPCATMRSACCCSECRIGDWQTLSRLSKSASSSTVRASKPVDDPTASTASATDATRNNSVAGDST